MTTDVTSGGAAGARPEEALDPSHLMQVGMGFWASKTVLSAIETCTRVFVNCVCIDAWACASLKSCRAASLASVTAAGTWFM